MAPTAPRPTPHEDALLDRTGIICASGHGPAAPPTPGMNRSGAAGFVAFVVMVLAAVTGVSGLESDGGSRLVAGDEVTAAPPQVPEGTGADEQGGDGHGAGTDEKPGDASQPRNGGDLQAGPVAPDADARSGEVQAPSDAETVPADDALAHGLEGPVPGVARAEPAAAGTNVTGSEVASARKADTAARETTRTSGTRVVGAWTSWQDRVARDRSAVERRVQRFGEELRRSIESHTTRHYGFRAPDTDARSRGARSDDVPGDDARGRDAARGEVARGGARSFEAILNTVTHTMRGHGPVQHIPTRQERGEAGARDGGEPVQSRSDGDENAEGEQVRSGDGRADRDGRDGSPDVVGERGWHDGGLPGSDAGAGHHGYGGYGDHPAYQDPNRAHEPRVDGAHDDGFYDDGVDDGSVPDQGGAYGGYGYGGSGTGW